MPQLNDMTFTTSVELVDFLMNPAGQKPNTLDPDLVK